MVNAVQDLMADFFLDVPGTRAEGMGRALPNI
jgi:hypothetical protein